MIQIVKKKVDNIEEITGLVNYVGINYEYFNDYQVINQGDSYHILLKFDTPTVLDSLQLANIKELEKDEDIFCYHICKYGDEKTSQFGLIGASKLISGVQIYFYWNIKSFINPITITYDKELKEFKVRLIDFNVNCGYGEDEYIEKNIILKEIDYKMIITHLIEVIKKEGYLFDKESIRRLERNIVALSARLNKKEFE